MYVIILFSYQMSLRSLPKSFREKEIRDVILFYLTAKIRKLIKRVMMSFHNMWCISSDNRFICTLNKSDLLRTHVGVLSEQKYLCHFLTEKLIKLKCFSHLFSTLSTFILFPSFIDVQNVFPLCIQMYS
jgi:hypothetical protein